MKELCEKDCEQVAGGLWVQPLEGEELARRIRELVNSLWQPASERTTAKEWT